MWKEWIIDTRSLIKELKEGKREMRSVCKEEKEDWRKGELVTSILNESHHGKAGFRADIRKTVSQTR